VWLQLRLIALPNGTFAVSIRTLRARPLSNSESALHILQHDAERSAELARSIASMRTARCAGAARPFMSFVPDARVEAAPEGPARLKLVPPDLSCHQAYASAFSRPGRRKSVQNLTQRKVAQSCPIVLSLACDYGGRC
jgi:hypothetical protein